jgi:hypothetical protein
MPREIIWHKLPSRRHKIRPQEVEHCMVCDVPGGVMFRVCIDTHDLGNISDWGELLPGATLEDFGIEEEISTDEQNFGTGNVVKNYQGGIK